ncbi:MAG: hypothetical protein LBD02_00195 [Christensenellaceae bacterium]|jgi:peptidoglycan glycosyltransferase|nr:hypothetical protein [Christensenellaceae bacterium]
MNQMQKNIRALTLALLVLFGSLIVYFFYTIPAYSGRWFATPYNTRLRAAKSKVIPGDIFDRNGVLLASTDGDGSRRYKGSSSLRRGVAHVLGDPQGLVPTGAETMFAAELLGFHSGLFDRFAQLFAERRRGSDVTLTIDAELSAYIASEFPDGYDGAVALMDYESGEILALYSSPAFKLSDPSASAEGALLNRALQGRYAPGSIFKLITLSCALENIPNVLDRQIDCTGHLQVTGAVEVTDTSGEGHGHLTMREAFEKSCNIAYASLALELGEDALRRTARNFGFNGNFLFPEVIVYESLFPSSIEDEGELAWTGVGQGKLLASPLHMAMIAGAMANGGVMAQPKLLLSAKDQSGALRQGAAAKSFQRAVSADQAAILHGLMLETVQKGTATRAAVSGLQIGGKTGTAQVNSSGGKYEPHSWFIGFCEEKRLCLAVVVENGGAGSGAASRLAGKIFKKANR